MGSGPSDWNEVLEETHKNVGVRFQHGDGHLHEHGGLHGSNEGDAETSHGPGVSGYILQVRSSALVYEWSSTWY